MAVVCYHYFPRFEFHWQSENGVLYFSNDATLLAKYQALPASTLRWSDLLPDSEKQLLSQYQTRNNVDFSEQLALSLQASADKDYKNALYSTNIVADKLEQPVSISGFIVPLELDDERNILSFFLVPYFGACIHYPPPPPNQIIFVQLEPGFKNTQLFNPFTLSGILQQGLFEDPLGTSAYQLNVVSIREFVGQPDDFRQH